jgi:undecaprenyl diphosphate synthase
MRSYFSAGEATPRSHHHGRNGRWAAARGGLDSRAPGRADSVRRVVEAAHGLGIGVLTLYAFSSDN